MKKKILTAAIISSVLMLGMQSAYAYRGFNGPGDCWRNNDQRGAAVQLDEETQKKYDAFYEETKELRRSIAAKRAEFRALMQGDNPDPAKAGQLKSELFDLQDNMRGKAKEAGINAGYGSGCGAGCGIRGRMACAGQGQGPGKGAGMGQGRGMRGPLN